MKTLIMCQGLPGSGKSTWAAQQPFATVVNKDTIRREWEAGGWVWSRSAEKDVENTRDQRINEAFASGVETVISDDTNFAPKHEQQLRRLAELNGALLTKRLFTNVPIAECIRLDAQREGKARVGADVIRKMANQYQVYRPCIHEKYTPPVPAMRALVCDLDGTLSLMNGRNPYDASTADQDFVNAPVKRMLEIYYRFMHYQIIYLSGRSEKYRPQTETFLRDRQCPPGPLHMRAEGDTRTDWMVKGELFEDHVRYRYDVDVILDDRNQVVEYWRSIRLTVFQVADGDF